MGDRISISFSDGEGQESVALFSHWDGRDFLKMALKYAKELQTDTEEEGGCYPLERYEPETMMVDFIRWMFEDSEGRIRGNYYLGKDCNDGDNSDNGHFRIIVTKQGVDFE